MNETPNPIPQKSDHSVAILAIIASTIVLLTCIAGCSAIFITLASRIH